MTALDFAGRLALSPDNLSAYTKSTAGYVLGFSRSSDGSVHSVQCQDLEDALSTFCGFLSGNGGGAGIPSPDGTTVLAFAACYAPGSTPGSGPSSGSLYEYHRAAAPTAVTGAATAVTSTSATIAGSVNPRGAAATPAFVSGTSAAHGASVSLAAVPAGYTDVAEQVTLHGLAPATTYHYAVTVASTNGTVTSADATFRTPAVTRPPTAPHLSSLRVRPGTFHVRHRIRRHAVAHTATVSWSDTQSARATVTILRRLPASSGAAGASRRRATMGTAIRGAARGLSVCGASVTPIERVEIRCGSLRDTESARAATR